MPSPLGPKEAKEGREDEEDEAKSLSWSRGGKNPPFPQSQECLLSEMEKGPRNVRICGKTFISVLCFQKEEVENSLKNSDFFLGQTSCAFFGLSHIHPSHKVPSVVCI